MRNLIIGIVIGLLTGGVLLMLLLQRSDKEYKETIDKQKVTILKQGQQIETLQQEKEKIYDQWVDAKNDAIHYCTSMERLEKELELMKNRNK